MSIRLSPGHSLLKFPLLISIAQLKGTSHYFFLCKGARFLISYSKSTLVNYVINAVLFVFYIGLLRSFLVHSNRNILVVVYMKPAVQSYIKNSTINKNNTGFKYHLQVVIAANLLELNLSKYY